MRILWVKAGKLLPVDTGGKIRSFNLLKHLARMHDVTLLSYYGGRRDPDYDVAIAKVLPGARTIRTSSPQGALAQSFDYALHLASPAPYAVRKFTDHRVREAIGQELTNRTFDIAVCDFLSASLNFPHSTDVPVVLFQHNVETMLWRRMAETETSLLRRLSYQIEAKKMAAYETAALRRFRHVIAVSEHDRDAMLTLVPDCLITVVPTGVDTEQFRAAPSAMTDQPTIVFTGSMDWEPNIDAMEYFCRRIWPKILAAFSQARFQIVGRDPHPRILCLKANSIEVTGTVPSVTSHLLSATVVVVPLRIGGGTRLKIYEAMAMGRAVVSTSIGAEGLDVTDRRDLLIADDEESFAASMLKLLHDAEFRHKIEQSAAALASRYDWSSIARRFADILRETIEASGNRAPAASPVSA